MSFSYDYGRGGRAAALITGAVIGALLVALVWAIQVWVGSDDGSVGRTGPVTNGSGVFEPAADDGTSRLDRCREVYDAQRDPLDAAARSLSQWEVHIGAMNKLVTGAITLRQAQQFWDQTRVGAMQRLNAFAAADRRFGERSARCPEPPDSAGASPELDTCAAAVAARHRTLSLATVALDTWEMHVHHMEMLRNGEMTPAAATRLWLHSWHQGNRQVQAYREAAKAADGKTC